MRNVNGKVIDDPLPFQASAVGDNVAFHIDTEHEQLLYSVNGRHPWCARASALRHGWYYLTDWL